MNGYTEPYEPGKGKRRIEWKIKTRAFQVPLEATE